MTDSEVIIDSDHKPLQKFIYALTANDRVNDWTFQIHAICRTVHFQFIQGTSNILSDSLSRLSYYDLYEKPKLEKPGFKFNKPKVDVSEDMYKPLKTAYQDEGLSIFILTQDPTGNFRLRCTANTCKAEKENILAINYTAPTKGVRGNHKEGRKTQGKVITPLHNKPRGNPQKNRERKQCETRSNSGAQGPYKNTTV